MKLKQVARVCSIVTVICSMIALASNDVDFATYFLVMAVLLTLLGWEDGKVGEDE